jgi:glycosyltransferase involved in cell wall biosynthesis
VKILYITQFFSFTRGGGEATFYFFARELAKRGHEIFVIRHRITPFEKLEGNLKVIDVYPAVKYMGGLPPSMKDNLLYLFNAIKAGCKIVKKHGVDVIHANNFTPVLVGSFIAKRCGIPLVVTIHDVFSVEGWRYWHLWARQFGVSPLSIAIGPIFERATLMAPATIIHTVSERSRKDLIEFGVDRPIFVVPNGIDLSLYSKANEVKPQAIYVGRLVFYKNLEVAINAFKEVLKVIPEARFIVVGDGPMRETWMNYVMKLGLKDKVKFTGYVSHKEKVRLISESCALIFPSLFEGFGMAILEAYACGRPVVVSNVEPLTDIVTDGYTGYLADPADPREWAEKMIRLMADRLKASRMGLNGRKLVEERFSIQKIAESIERLYECAINFMKK